MALDLTKERTRKNLNEVRSIAGEAVDVTPNDSTDLATLGAALYVGTGGSVKVDITGSGTVTFTNVANGTFMPIYVDRVYATGTTASGIIALY